VLNQILLNASFFKRQNTWGTVKSIIFVKQYFFPEFQALSEPLSQMSVNWSDKKYIPVNIA